MSARAKLQLVAAPAKPSAALVDEYCDLAEKMKAWKPNVNPHAARFQEVAALILKGFETHAPAAVVAEGVRYRLPISARRMKRWAINLEGFFRKVGRQRYVEMCPPTLGNIEKAIPADKLDLYIAESQTGNRIIGQPVQREAVKRRAAA